MSKVYEIVDKVRGLVNSLSIEDVRQYVQEVCQVPRKGEYCRFLSMLLNFVLEKPEGIPREVWTRFLKWTVVLLAISDKLLWSQDVRDWAEGQVYCASLDMAEAVLLPAVLTQSPEFHEKLRDIVETLMRLAFGTVDTAVRMLLQRLH